ncbi:MAG: hypothetical protein CM1200mP18_04450 [Gammaproteobacteria bacterium]|nr:MAG: hypothetical protein CM1200mP18_04450 [Gammaproteobacteria bacterium]
MGNAATNAADNMTRRLLELIMRFQVWGAVASRAGMTPQEIEVAELYLRSGG